MGCFTVTSNPTILALKFHHSWVVLALHADIYLAKKEVRTKATSLAIWKERDAFSGWFFIFSANLIIEFHEFGFHKLILLKHRKSRCAALGKCIELCKNWSALITINMLLTRRCIVPGNNSSVQAARDSDFQSVLCHAERKFKNLEIHFYIIVLVIKR